MVVVTAVSALAITPLAVWLRSRLALLLALVLGLAFGLGLPAIGFRHLPGLLRTVLHAAEALGGVALQVQEERVGAGQVQGLVLGSERQQLVCHFRLGGQP